mgnify:CR=1 FL=1
MCFHIGSRHAVALVDVGEGVVTAEGVAVYDALDQTADIKEADLIPQEMRNGGFVCAVGSTCLLYTSPSP